MLYDLDDRLLIERVIQKTFDCEQALGVLFERYSGKLAAYLKAKMNLEPHQIDDVIQDSFITASKSLASLNDPTKFYAWLVTIARNKMIDTIRANKKYCDIQEWFEELHDEPAAEMEASIGLEKMIAGLDPKDQEIILMKIILDLSFSEIAEVLGIKQSAAKMRYYRALDELKPKFEGQADD